METGLEGRPWYFGAGIGLLLAGAIVFGGHYLKLKGMYRTIQGQESKLADLQNQIQRGEAAQRQLPQFQARVASLEAQLAQLVSIIPNRRNVHILLRQFRALAEREDFTLNRFAPGQTAEKEFYSEWPISVNLEGTYHNLARFFDRMSRLSRIINVEDLSISARKPQSGSRSINASFVAKTYVYKEDEETNASPAQGGAP